VGVVAALADADADGEEGDNLDWHLAVWKAFEMVISTLLLD